jgi:hypothetical protein
VVTYKTEFGLDDWIYCMLYIHITRGYRHYSAIAVLRTFQFTITQILGFSVLSWQRIHHFLSHMKTSLHSLIHLLPFLFNHLRLPSPELDPFLILPAWDSRYIASRRTPRKTPPSIIKDACLLVLSLDIDVILLRARVLRECVYRPVA